jgi:hypothetical protein
MSINAIEFCGGDSDSLDTSLYYHHLRCSIQQMHKAPSDLEIVVEELLQSKFTLNKFYLDRRQVH